jgi:hypothetical protein
MNLSAGDSSYIDQDPATIIQTTSYEIFTRLSDSTFKSTQQPWSRTKWRSDCCGWWALETRMKTTFHEAQQRQLEEDPLEIKTSGTPTSQAVHKDSHGSQTCHWGGHHMRIKPYKCLHLNGLKLTQRCTFIQINPHHSNGTSLPKTYCTGDWHSTYSQTLGLCGLSNGVMLWTRDTVFSRTWYCS